jgi:hypothetical protein
VTITAHVNYGIRENDLPRMWSFVNPDLNTGCWIWGGPLNRYGYGVFTVSNPNRWLLAHRAVYVSTISYVPEDRFLDHKCRTRCCVNPAHLRVVTFAENLIENSIGPAAINKAKTHCVVGHEFTAENTYHRPDKPHTRTCRRCRDAYMARSKVLALPIL